MDVRSFIQSRYNEARLIRDVCQCFVFFLLKGHYIVECAHQLGLKQLDHGREDSFTQCRQCRLTNIKHTIQAFSNQGQGFLLYK